MPRSALLAVLPWLWLLPMPLALAADLAYVDMQRILEESKLGQRLQEQLRKQFEPRGEALATEEQQIRQLQQTLDRDGPLMSVEQFKQREAEIKKRIAAYQEQAAGIQQELMKVQQEKGREIILPARDALTAIAKKKKLAMVVERSQTGLLYIDDALDLTAEVIKAMDAGTK